MALLLQRLEPSIAFDPVEIMRDGLPKGGDEPDPWQMEFLRNTPHRCLMMCGRQVGKSTVVAASALHEALAVPGSTTVLVSKSERQSKELLAKVRRMAYKQRGVKVGSPRSWGVQTVTLDNGSRIMELPANEETIRGFSADLLVVDEAALVPDDLYHATLRPMLAATGGRVVAMTTPAGRSGWFYDLWKGDDQRWERIHLTAYDCPRISREFLEEERETSLAHVFAQEYLAEFVDEVEGAPWDRETIDRNRVTEHEPEFWRRVVIGIDPSDGTSTSDEQAYCVVGQSAEDSHLYVLDSRGYREEPWKFLNRVCDVAETFWPNPCELVIEKNHGGEWIASTLEQVFRTRKYIPYRMVTASKGKITRAEPVAAMYRRKRVHHVGSFPKLEVQMTSYTGKAGEKSPDLLDSLVWAMEPFSRQQLDTSELADHMDTVIPFEVPPPTESLVPGLHKPYQPYDEHEARELPSIRW